MKSLEVCSCRRGRELSVSLWKSMIYFYFSIAWLNMDLVDQVSSRFTINGEGSQQGYQIAWEFHLLIIAANKIDELINNYFWNFLAIWPVWLLTGIEWKRNAN